jgi:gamma-glutamyl:cysteine ligase YbdK (ATP-grasp superfamily)
MGIEIDKTSFSPPDYKAFSSRLDENLAALNSLLADPDFGQGAASLGAELEMYLIDADGKPLYMNEEVVAAAREPGLTLELNRYNLEYNLDPHAFSAAPFISTESEILAKLQRVRAVAAAMGGRVVPIGILPTLRQTDFGSHCITPRQRYRALVKQLIRRRGDRFKIDINGEEPLKLDMSDITLEGANTSFQVHLRVKPQDYADTFNAIQLVTPLALAIGANSPTLFGHRLWDETRIPLFKQSIDTRHVDRYSLREPARVNVGQGWVRAGAQELFREVVSIYPPLLPICADTSPLAELQCGLVPTLSELRLHQSSVWLWNRPIYDDAAGGHLRIEMRALPAGPTAVDMVANAAFHIGLAEGLRPRINELLPAIPFRVAEYNFYRAAQHGLDARLVWPQLDRSGHKEQPVTAIIEQLLPLAKAGLDALGIDAAESGRYVGVIAQRLAQRQTGASWQRHTLERLKRDMSLDNALHQLLDIYYENSVGNSPVAEWVL